MSTEAMRHCADDIRQKGWSVAVHNDYTMGGLHWTFWLFTKGDRCVKGEGTSDAEALDIIRQQIADPDLVPLAAAMGKKPGNSKKRRR